MAPKEELFKPFERKLEVKRGGCNVVLEWQYVDERVFFRRCDAPVDLLWTPGRGWRYNSQNEAWFLRCLSHCFRVQDYCRVVALCEIAEVPPNSWLFSRMRASGIVLSGKEPEESFANWELDFDWKEDQFAFLQAPNEFFWERAAHTIRTNPEEWHSILEWACRDEESRFWSQVLWKCGGQKDWLGLVRALLQLSLSHPKCPNINSWSLFILQQPHRNFSRLRMNQNLYARDFSSVVWELLDFVENYFDPRVDHRRFGTLGPSVFYLQPRSPVVRAEKPTQHELMTAIELWREFGSEIGQLAQVEACLRQLLT